MRQVLCRRSRSPQHSAWSVLPDADGRLLRGHRLGARCRLALRRLLEYGLDESTPDHSSLSRIRHRIDLETHREIFTWVLGVLAKEKLVDGKTIGIDAKTLEANTTMRSVVRRDIGENYEEFPLCKDSCRLV